MTAQSERHRRELVSVAFKMHRRAYHSDHISILTVRVATRSRVHSTSMAISHSGGPSPGLELKAELERKDSIVARSTDLNAEFQVRTRACPRGTSEKEPM